MTSEELLTSLEAEIDGCVNKHLALNGDLRITVRWLDNAFLDAMHKNYWPTGAYLVFCSAVRARVELILFARKAGSM